MFKCASKQSTLDNFVKESSEDKKEEKCNSDVSEFKIAPYTPQKIKRNKLNVDYAVIFTKSQADIIYERLEREVEYFTGDLLKVKIFGMWHRIPRQQVSYGDTGLTYTFSGNTIPAKPWIPLVSELCDVVSVAAGIKFNFVLINRYKDGRDHIGEHRDNEKDLEKKMPIASLSFGEERDFVLRHKDARKKNSSCKIKPVEILLQHGSLLVMKYPTNEFWFHSLPVRKNVMKPRINLTFRRMVVKEKTKS